MEIRFYGGNCVKISSKKSSVVIDDIVHLGGKAITTDKDILLVTDPRFSSENVSPRFLINGPGEYEVSEVSITGVAARSHLDEEKTANATMYRIIMDDIRIAAVGHVHPDLSEEQLEELGTIDVLLVPVGGNGYTLDGIGAQKIVRKIEPKIVIPTHYGDNSLKFEIPQQDLETTLKSLAMEPSDRVDVLKLKNLDMSEVTKLIVIDKK